MKLIYKVRLYFINNVFLYNFGTNGAPYKCIHTYVCKTNHLTIYLVLMLIKQHKLIIYICAIVHTYILITYHMQACITHIISPHV